MAESLAPVAEPLLTVLGGWRRAGPTEVIEALGRSLARPRADDTPPSWLWPGQAETFIQLLPILRQHGGALLAGPVGSGKTFVALAAALAWNGPHPTTVIVPSVLAEQWRRHAAALGAPVMVWTHERLSRGGVPPTGRRHRGSLVVIDESHHFRNPAAKRYLSLAPALVGHSVLLLSATPIVNRLADLAHQLLLGIRDDSLAFHELRSLRECLKEGRPDPAISELILENAAAADTPGRRDRRLRPGGASAPILESVDSLVLSHHPAIAPLIRTVLLRAAASSPAALLAALRRYHHLLGQARDAGAVGRTLTRSDIRTFTGEDAGQLVFWELLPPSIGSNDLAIDDLDRLEPLISQASRDARRPDARCLRLISLLADGRMTLVFTGSRDTVRYLQGHLPGPVAWCRGNDAGIGSSPAPRQQVLDWFRPDGPRERLEQAGLRVPRVLVCTDVAAEGLDLQDAERVVHYDLPWTSVRMNQRAGRAIRSGSRHGQVEVIRFAPPGWLEARLKQEAILRRKAKLPELAGIGAGGHRCWSWRDNLATRLAGPGHAHGATDPRFPVAVVRGEFEGIIAGFVLDSGSGRHAVLGLLGPTSVWCEDPVAVERALEAARRGSLVTHPDRDLVEDALRRVADIVRRHLRAGPQAWHPALDEKSTRLIRRLNGLAAAAARRRDHRLMALVEAGLGFAARGHTAGESALTQQLGAAGAEEFVRALSNLPSWTRPSSARPVLAGVVVGLGD